MKRHILYSLYIAVLLALLYFDKVLTFVMNIICKLTHPIQCSGIVLCAIGTVVVIAIEILRRKYPIVHKSKKAESMAHPLFSDQPTTDDKFDRTISAEILIEKIFSTFHAKQAVNGSFVVNINESYGFGKTSFLLILEKQLRSRGEEHIFIDYRPWLCDSEQSIVNEFFTLLLNELPDSNIKDDISTYLKLLLSQVQDTIPPLIRPFTAILSNSLRYKTLREYHDSIKKSLSQIGCPIIVTIDDVDRLQEKELTAVMKLIRDTADFPNVFYIVAADNAHLEMMLSKIGVQNPDNYLKKFFNLDYLLPAHESVPTKELKTKLEEILNSYGYNEYITSSLIMLQRLPNLGKAFVNMREVNRFLNAYTSSLDMLRRNNNLRLINPYELFYLTIIRHLRIDIFKKLRDRNDEFLEVINRGLDTCFHLKDDFNIEKIQRHKKFQQNINGKNGQLSSEERKNKQIEAEKLTLDDVMKLTEYTRNQMVTVILDYLFGNLERKDEHSICRCNVYFLYFSGKIETNKLTTAESVAILKMKQKDYEKTICALFDSNKANAFSNNFSYAFHKARIEKEDAMKKYYTLLKWQFKYRYNNTQPPYNTFEDYINKGYESFSNFLFDLYGRDMNDEEKQTDKLMEENLKVYCTTEPDINMLTLAFYLFSQRLEYFRFGREFINPTLELLAERLIKERMTECDPINNIDESIFSNMILFKDEFATKEQWETKFEQFICEDENRCMRWLCCMVSFYSNGRIEWNYRHHEAIIGEYTNSGDHLYERIKQKFPNHIDIVDELIHFQNRVSNLMYPLCNK